MPRWALVLAALLLLPLAAAQVPQPGAASVNLTLELQDPGTPLVPQRPYALQLVLHYQYSTGGATPPGSDPCATVSVPNPPPWAEVRITPATVCFPIDPTRIVGGTTVDNTTFVEVNVTEGAPALEAYNLTVQATVPATGSLAAATGETSRVITPGFVGRVEARSPGQQLISGGQTQMVPLTVVNQGNGPIEVRFRNFTAPQGVRVTLPERVVLAGPGDERTVFVTLLAPWTTPARGQVELQAESSHPSRPDLAGDPVRVRFDLASKAAVPGMEPLVALAALGLALALARRR